MSQQATALTDPSTHTEWMWQSNSDPWSTSQPAKWSHFSDVENLIIEEAFKTNQPQAMLDDYYIDLNHSVQISKSDDNKHRPIKRQVRTKDGKQLREERFMLDPIAPDPFGGEYGWVSPFIIEVRKYLNLKNGQLPSRDKTVVSMIVHKAARGIIEEGKMMGKLCEAEKMAQRLMEKSDGGIEEVWKCCAYLYSMESFLYRGLNEAMRLIGSREHEQVWRSKIQTLGPFCLLLWDNPFENKLTTNKLLYRGVTLTPEQIATYENLAKHPDGYRSFQALTSCSRNRAQAERFGNVLFVMEVKYAFITDLSLWSEYNEKKTL